MYNSNKKLIAAFVLPLATVPVSALEYSVAPSVEAYATHDDNIRLSPQNPTSLQGREVRTALDSGVASETWQLDLDIDLRFNNFNREEYDSDDQYIDLNFNKNAERQSFGVRSSVVRDSTRTSEIEDSGVVGFEAQRKETYRLNPYWSYFVNSTNRLTLNGSYSEIDFAESASRLTDYDSAAASLSWFSVVDEDLTLQFMVSGYSTEYDSRELQGRTYLVDTAYELESESYSAQVGGEFKFTEQLTIDALVGVINTKQQTDVTDPESACETGVPATVSIPFFPFSATASLIPNECLREDFDEDSVTGEIGAKWSGERSNWGVRYSIEHVPSSLGYTVESEKARANWKYRLTETSNVEFRFLYGQVEALDASSATTTSINDNRDFVNTRLVYSHRVADNWSVVADLGYRWQEREAARDGAESYAIKMGISYTPTGSIWSR